MCIVLYNICFSVYGNNLYQGRIDDSQNFDIIGAIDNMKQLQISVDEINEELYILDEKETQKTGDMSDKYKETRKEIVSVIKTISTTTQEVSNILKKISIYRKQIFLSQKELKDIQSDIKITKKYIIDFANFMYKIDNNLYSNTAEQIDELKLLLKSDNIPQTLASDYIIKSIIQQFNSLMEELDKNEKKQINLIKRLNRLKINANNQIKSYDLELEKLQQKKNYLIQFIELYKNDRFRENSRINNLFESVKEVYLSVNSMVDDIKSQKYTFAFDVKDKLEKLKSNKEELTKDTHPLARPVYPISYLGVYFADQEFKKQYGVEHEGIQIGAYQGTPVYSAGDGIVYHVVNQENIGINRILILHDDGYITTYMYMNKIIVQLGQNVRRGELIGYSGGEPGTVGAGFISKGSNLTFGIYKDGVAIDPLKILDLSVLQNKSLLSDIYHIKYLQDKYSRFVDVSDLNFMTGQSVSQRSDAFLRLYGVGIYKELAFWEDAVKGSNIDRDVVICIAFAESTLGRYLTTENNIGNVGNDDGGNRISFGSALEGAKLIANTLNNRYLGNYHTIKQLSRYGNKDGKIYASSPINRQTNVTKCLSQIKGYYVPEDFPFRTGINPNNIIIDIPNIE